jgi:peroxiredoxin Q/BCP
MLSALLAAATASVIAGQAAPPFDLPSDHGGNIKLADLRGKRVVLAFFPKAFTGG